MYVVITRQDCLTILVVNLLLNIIWDEMILWNLLKDVCGYVCISIIYSFKSYLYIGIYPN